MPSLSAFARRFAPKGLQVVAVSVDEGWEGVKAFFPHGKPAFRVLLDPGREIAVTYGTVKFPETYLVGPDGVLKAKFIGARDWSDARIIRYFEKLTGLE
jgi:peroxiredoxin